MTINFDQLFKLRLVVARYGEMDCMGWWNTRGVLSPAGTVVYGRGFPRTAPFAMARVVFAVARLRTREIWSPVGCATLWNLPPQVEDAFEDHWQGWRDSGEQWRTFFNSVSKLAGQDLLADLLALRVITAAAEQEARELRRSLDNRAVLLPGVRTVDDATLVLLGAGFFRGEKGALAVPYARLDN